MKKFVLAITGATGPIIGLRVLKALGRTAEVHMIISRQSFSILRDESGVDLSGENAVAMEKKIRKLAGSKNIYWYDEGNFEAPVASGSFRTDGMFVIPCSMKSLSGIANGYSNSLIERAADVTIKEGRPLVLAPREMPFSPIHLENMLKLARIGVKIAPPVIGFYHGPKTIDDMVDFVAGKILDLMGVEHEIYKRWGK
ncbi:MAG: UbiX family flavin prenyltransferase [Nitrospiraceae bacterium]|nr:UbiX family flavin prenyltransferase [Nitrospiraceae bacterium]